MSDPKTCTGCGELLHECTCLVPPHERPTATEIAIRMRMARPWAKETCEGCLYQVGELCLFGPPGHVGRGPAQHAWVTSETPACSRWSSLDAAMAAVAP
jgi:hypothetical protein